jgi:hypothetical protein
LEGRVGSCIWHSNWPYATMSISIITSTIISQNYSGSKYTALKNHENGVSATWVKVNPDRKCEGVSSSRRCGTTVQVTKLSW